MPVILPSAEPLPAHPSVSHANIDAARTSAWLPTFEDVSIPSIVINIDELGERDAFLEWLRADSIFMPEGSQHDPDAPVYKLPRLNEAIRAALTEHGGAVFPKLNWTSPRDAAFILPQGDGPLHCTSPADVYLLVASSDFVSHDLDPVRAYASAGPSSGSAGPSSTGADTTAPLELVLKKYMLLNPAREFRCFVRDRVLIGISQRDPNYYDHLELPNNQSRIRETIREFWEDEIWDSYGGGADYVFDVHLDDTYTTVTIIDFGIYRPSTDPLLFSYAELADVLTQSRVVRPSDVAADESAGGDAAALVRLPVLRVIDSPSHPDARRNAPLFAGNMMPLEMVQMSAGASMDELREAWEGAIEAGMAETDSDDDEHDAR